MDYSPEKAAPKFARHDRTQWSGEAVHFTPVNYDDFLSLELPPRNLLLAPWLPAGGLAMLYAPRGVGKTYVALEIAWAVASGGTFLNWSAPSCSRVVYIDGEMPASALQERLQGIQGRAASNPPTTDHFKLLTSDLQRDGLPDLSNPDQQTYFDDAIESADLIIIDNLSTLCRSGRENEGESWTYVQEWALRQRRGGRSVLFIHHASKGGGQRGTSRREDVLDSVLSLRRPLDYHASEGARFEIHFEKSRGFTGEDANPFEAALTPNGWVVSDAAEPLDLRVLTLSAEGLTQREIAKKVGASLGKVNAILKSARAG